MVTSIQLLSTGGYRFFQNDKSINSSEAVRRRAGIERELASRADQRVLRWFGHVERMDEYRMARKVLMAEVSEGRHGVDRG